MKNVDRAKLPKGTWSIWLGAPQPGVPRKYQVREPNLVWHHLLLVTKKSLAIPSIHVRIVVKSNVVPCFWMEEWRCCIELEVWNNIATCFYIISKKSRKDEEYVPDLHKHGNLVVSWNWEWIETIFYHWQFVLRSIVAIWPPHIPKSFQLLRFLASLIYSIPRRVVANHIDPLLGHLEYLSTSLCQLKAMKYHNYTAFIYL